MNTCPDLLAALHTRMRDLELEACDVKARVSELRDVIDRLERPQRRGRPRKLEAVEPPLHVAGGNHQPTQPDDDELPFQSDAPGA
jgi:hypothetical protein